MINLFRRKGAATLIMTVVLFVLSTLIILFAANLGKLQNQASANLSRYNQAYAAAEAGLEFGINYLKQNSATILANPVSGHIPAYSDSSTSNVTLANNSTYTITYTNPIANNYDLIKVSSTGTSDDGSATHTISQEVEQGSLLSNPPSLPLITKGSVSMSGNAQIINTTSNTTIESASTVSLTGSSSTLLNSGTSSTAGSLGSDIQQNSSSLSSTSQGDFFATYFGASTTAVAGSVSNYYNNSSDTNYSSTLAGKTGTSIWIDQTNGTATINGSTTIGSASNPVLLIVNGSLSLSGNVTIYGFLFVIGTNDITTFSGNTKIIGGMATTETLNMSGSIEVTYDPAVLDNLQNQPSLLYYAKVPGSWKDF